MHPEPPQLCTPRSLTDWDRLHAIRRKEIFDRYHPPDTPWWVPYDPDYPDDRDPANRPLVQLLGEDVVGTCRVDRLADGLAALRLVAVAANHRGRGLGAELVGEAEEVAAALGAGTLCLNAQPQVVEFYRRLGWTPGEWRGQSRCRRSVPMRKALRCSRAA